MDLQLAGRVAIVTGGSRGLGFYAAQALAREGAQLAISARGEEVLEQTAQRLRAEHGVEVLAVPGDVMQEADCRRLVDATVARYGRIDALVNNAGGSISQGTLEQMYVGSFMLNVMSAIWTMEMAKPHLARSPGGGAVVNVSSIYGRETGGGGPYNTAKSAQIAMSKAYALAWAKDNVRVNNLAPGSIAFPGGGWQRRIDEQPEAMAEFIKHNLPVGRFGRGEEIGTAVAFLCSPVASWVLGAAFNVDGGQSRSNI